MKKLKCYYAHTMTSYDSTIEEQDIELLEKLNFEVVNPNTEETQSNVDEYIKKHGKDKVMDYFGLIIDDCDLVAFRSIPTGEILSGVAFELNHAYVTDKPIIELPCSIQKRIWDYPTTKKYLIELGHYKVVANEK